MKLIPVQARVSALQIGKHRHQHVWDQCHKAGIAHQMGKFTCEMNLHMFRRVGFERPIVRLMTMNENGHHLAWVQLTRSLPLFSCCELDRLQVCSEVEPANHRHRKITQVNSLLDPSDDERSVCLASILAHRNGIGLSRTHVKHSELFSLRTARQREPLTGRAGPYRSAALPIPTPFLSRPLLCLIQRKQNVLRG